MQLWGAEPPAPQNASSSGSNNTTPTSSDDLKALRERISQQEEQIKKLTEAVAEQRTILDKAVASSNAAMAPVAVSAPAPVASGSTGPDTVAVANHAGSVPVVPAYNVGRPPRFAAANRAGGQNLQAANPSPLGIRIGNSTFTPLGFVDFTWFGRSSAVGSGLGTNFAGIPYNTSSLNHLSENDFSAQNSRIGFRVDSTVAGNKVLGYFEGDFFGNQAPNVFVSNNAATFRLRLFFVDLTRGKLEILGGQEWSMFTPSRKGFSPLPSDVFYTQNMDLNYQAGLVWARQPQFRLLYHPTKDWVAGISLENPQQYIGGSGGSNGGSVTLPTALAPVLLTQFNNAANAVAVGTNSVTGGGNYSTPNLHPDIILKSAYDAHVGKKDQIFHVEAGALIRSFKDSIPTGTPTRYVSNSATAVSGEVNANLEVVKNFRLIANTFFGEGGGRYIFGLAPDVIVRANGTISPLHSYSTVDGFEWQAQKNTLVDAYYGGVYIGKQIALDPSSRTRLIGYGFPGSGPNDNKAIQEFTFGVTQTFWKNPNVGALSLITQYSYLTRDPWSVVSPAPKNTHTNLYYVDLRYTLP